MFTEMELTPAKSNPDKNSGIKQVDKTVNATIGTTNNTTGAINNTIEATSNAPTSYRDIFNIRGQMYHDAMAQYPQARAMEFQLPLAELDLQPGDTLIDLPSGGGYLADYISHDINLHCLESSQAFAQLCQAKGHHVSLFSNDQLPLPNQSVDKIVSIAGLHHIEDKVPLFTEMQRILKSQGQICIADVEHNSPVALFLDDIVHRYTETGHRGSYLGEHIVLELEQAGFQQIQHKQIHYTWNFPSVEAMVSYCRLLFGMEKASLEQVHLGIKQYLGYQEDKDGAVGLDWQLCCLMAYKEKTTR